jgi:hypothetical protein
MLAMFPHLIIPFINYQSCQHGALGCSKPANRVTATPAITSGLAGFVQRYVPAG